MRLPVIGRHGAGRVMQAGRALAGAGFLLQAVARASIPLMFYGQAAYARAAPPLLAGLLPGFGPAALGPAVLCSACALAPLLRLAARRPASGPGRPAAASP